MFLSIEIIQDLIFFEGKGYPLQYSGLENSMDYTYSPWGHKESDTTERLSLSLTLGGWTLEIDLG